MTLRAAARLLAVEKAMDSQEKRFNAIVRRLKNTLSGTWDKQARATIIDCIRVTEGYRGTPSGLWRVLSRRFEQSMGADIGEAVKKPLVDALEASYTIGAELGAEAWPGMRFAWMEPDLVALDTLTGTHKWWIGTHYGDSVQGPVEAVLRPFFEGQMDRGMVAVALEESMGVITERSAAYWNLLADHVCTKTREIGRVSGYEQADVRAVKVRAQLDAKTTEVCRAMHGQVIAVSDLRSQVDGYLKACETRDKTKIKEAWPWWTEKNAAKGLSTQKKVNRQVARGKIGLPPYHAHCRTITVAEFIAAPGVRVDD